MIYKQRRTYSQTLMHYASQYYDPQAASEYNHAYYEAHKKLKGRKPSTYGLNQEGRQIASEVKANIDAEKKAKQEALSNKQTSEVEEIKQLIEAIKSLGEKEREEKKIEIQSKIESLRSELKTKKENLQNALTAKREDISQKNKAASKKVSKENKSIKEKLTKEVERKRSENTAENDRIREQIKKLGNSEADKQKKAELQAQIKENSVKLKEDIALTRAASTETTTKNSENLTEFKEKNTADLQKYSEQVKSQIQSATEQTQSGITSLRNELKAFNDGSRAVTKEAVSKCQQQIKDLKKTNAAAKKALTDYYNDVYAGEIEKIKSEEQYQAKNKKKNSGAML